MKSEKKKRTSMLILLSIITVMLLATGITMAYLADKTPEVVNTFTPSGSEITIEEDFKDNIKKNVKVKNTGDTDAYIRADIVVNWKDKNGNVLGIKPVENEDYTLKMASPLKWENINGLYYYKGKVAPGSATDILISECKPVKKAPAEGYTLHVEILAEAIQAEPDTAITEAWGVTPQELGVK